MAISLAGARAQDAHPAGEPNQPAHTLQFSGNVLDPQDKPVAGAAVTMYRLGLDREATWASVLGKTQVTTSEDGAFSFTTQPSAAGSRQFQVGMIVAQKPGLALGCITWNQRPGRADYQLQIKLDTPEILAGAVVDEQGAPIPDAEVRVAYFLVGQPTPEPSYYFVGVDGVDLLTVRTDAQGRFRLEDLPAPARAELLAKKPGRATVCTLHLTSASWQSLTFQAGRTDIKLTLPLEARVAGQVVAASDGRPLSGVRLIVHKADALPFPLPQKIVSDTDGSFSAGALEAGDYLVKLPPAGADLPEWVAQDVPVTVQAGQTTRDVKVELSKGGVLEVTLTDAENQPVPGASVLAYSDTGGTTLTVVSGQDGRARLRLLPGSYRVVAMHKGGYASWTREGVVAIDDRRTTRITAVLQRLPKLRGIVRDEAGLSVEGADVVVLSGQQSTAATDKQGRFEVNWNPAGLGGQQTPCYLIARHEKRNLAAVVEIKEETKNLDVNLLPALTIRGNVLDPNGKPVADAKVRVMLRTDNWAVIISAGRLTANDAGEFVVSALPPQYKYDVNVEAEGYGAAHRQIDADQAVHQTLPLGDLTLRPANLALSGVVVDDQDKPVAQARVFYNYADGEPSLNREIVTDSAGKFRIEKVCAGEIRLSAQTKGEARLLGQVQTEGGATDVKIVLQEERQFPTASQPRQVNPPVSLVGKPLPLLATLGVTLDPNLLQGKTLLICFFDMNQRPSRHALTQLNQRAKGLADRGVVLVAIQTAKVPQADLAAWAKQANIAFPVGMVAADETTTLQSWGVRALPWLILTDKRHVVRTEGLTLDDLEK